MYEWAGALRTVNIEKYEDMLGGLSIEYSDCEQIEKDAESAIRKLHFYEWDKMGLDEKSVAFSDCMAELWKIHPFREGNTRTVITFCCDFAESKGFGIDRDLFKDNSVYMGQALVAWSAKFSDIGDYSKPQYLYKIVKDGMNRWEKAKIKDKECGLSMKDWKNAVERPSEAVSSVNPKTTLEKSTELDETERD